MPSTQQEEEKGLKTLIAIATLAVLGLAAALGTVLLGLPDVAATTPHWPITRWVLSTTMESAVERRAAETRAPDDLADSARIRAGAAAYDAMCVGCHAGPGVEAAALAKGLLPEPPELREAADEWSAAELFWITRHGVRMTGMPAFGPTHEDRELWDLVAFLQRLPELSPSQYRVLVRAAESQHGARREATEDREDEHRH